MKLAGQVALVTGASRGLGLAIARALAREGAHTAVAARRPGPLCEVAQEINGLAIPADVSRFEECERLVATTLSHFGRLDILVNNAAVCTIGEVAEADPADWQKMWEVNFKGTAFCSKAALTPMLEQGSGDILNIASGAGLRGLPQWSGYCASKFAVIGFAQALGQEVLEKGIRVQTICPGGIDTPLWDDLNVPVYAAGSSGRAQLMPAESVADMTISMLAQPRTVVTRQVLMFPPNEWH